MEILRAICAENHESFGDWLERRVIADSAAADDSVHSRYSRTAKFPNSRLTFAKKEILRKICRARGESTSDWLERQIKEDSAAHSATGSHTGDGK